MATMVKAKKTGTYPSNRLREPGDVFELQKAEHFSERWMEKIGAKEAKESIEASGVPASRAQLQNAAEVRQLKQQAAIASQTGAEVAPPDPRAAVEFEEKEDGKSGKQNRRI